MDETNLEQREKELTQREMRLLARETLTEKGMDKNLLAFVNLDSRESCLNSINTLEQTLAAEVSRRVAQKTPPLPGAARAVNEEELTDAEYYACKYGHNGI